MWLWIECEVCGFYHSSLDEYGDIYDCWVHLVNKRIQIKKLLNRLSKIFKDKSSK